jgi:hypothetical protein
VFETPETGIMPTGAVLSHHHQPTAVHTYSTLLGTADGMIKPETRYKSSLWTPSGQVLLPSIFLLLARVDFFAQSRCWSNDSFSPLSYGRQVSQALNGFSNSENSRWVLIISALVSWLMLSSSAVEGGIDQWFDSFQQYEATLVRVS